MGFFIVISVFCIGFLFAAIVCAIVESRVTAPYKILGVYSRPFAYIFMTAFMTGVFFIITPFAVLLAGNMLPPAKISEIIILFVRCSVFAAAFLIFSYFMYNAAKRNCPAELQKKLFSSLLISGLGVTFKICFFYIPGIWDLPYTSSK